MKRKTIRTVLVGILGAIASLLILCAIVINTSAFRNFLISEIRSQVLESTGARVEIGSLRTHWLRLAFELRDITVHGKESLASSESPLAQASDLKVSILFAPLLHGKVLLGELVLDEPVVHVRIDAQGNTNLPVAPQPSGHDVTAKVFNLEVRNCAIRSGQLFYDDAQIPLDAQLHDLKFQAGYEFTTGKYKGLLAYDSGVISTRGIEPISHAVQMQFVADRSGLSLNPLVLKSGGSSFKLNARIQNYANPSLDGNYTADVLTAELGRTLRVAELPIGEVLLDGNVAYRRQEQQTALAGLFLQGHMRSEKLQVRTNERPLEATSITANYELRDANLRVSDFSADVLAGRARGDWEVLAVGSSHTRSKLDASLSGVSLRRVNDALAPRDVRRIPVVGRANLNLSAAWSGSIEKMVAHARLAISSPKQSGDQHATIPVNGLVQADYDGARGTVSFGRSYLQTASTRISIAGMLSPRRAANSEITATISAGDLQEVSSLASLVANALPHSAPVAIPDLAGRANLHATITGAVSNPHIQGQLSAQDLSVDGSRWKALSLNLSAQPSKVSVENGSLSAQSQGQITFSGSAALQRWTLAPNSAISLRASATNLSAADAEKIARLTYPVSGVLSANLSVSGTRQNPQANGTVTLKRATAWSEPIDNLSVHANSTNGTIQTTLSVQAPAGTVSADASYRLADEQYQLNLHGTGLQLAKISVLQRSAPVQGTMEISATGSGTIHDPQLQATLRIPQLEIQDQVASGVSVQIALAHQHANFALHSTIYQGSVDAKGDVDMNGSRYANASVDVRSLPLGPVLAAFVHTEASKISGQTEIHASLSGPLANPAQMEAHVEIPTLSLAYEKAQLALAQPLKADYRGGVLTLNPTRIQGTGTNLTFGGRIPVRSASTYSLMADGSVDLGVVQQFAPDVHSSGQVLVHVRSSGPSASGVHGELQLKNAIFSSDSVPVGIEGLNAQVNFSGNRADIANFSGTAGGGSVSMSGFVTYGRETNFNLALNAKSVRIRYPEGLRSVLSGQIYASGKPSSSMLTGRVLVDRLSFTQAFDLANFAGYFSETSTGEPPSLFERRMKMNIAVQSAQDLSLASSKLSIGGVANMTVIGTLADPVVLGRISLTSGEVFFLSKRFEVQSGTIQFANATRTEPVLNLRVTTTIEQYDVTLQLSGPVERLKTTYTSSPALPPADIIHLLAFGNTTEEAGAAPSSSMASSAESVLAQGVSSQAAGKIENLTGISQLTIDPLAANSQGNPGAQIAVQERVTGSLLLTFSTDVTSTQSQTVEVQYQLNKKVSVTVLRDQYGGYGIDLRLHKEF